MDSIIVVRLRLVERRMRWQRCLEMASRGLLGGLVVSIVLAIGSRLLPILSLTEQVVVEALIVFTAALISGAVGFVKGYKLLQVARVVDRRARLQERLSTAVELADRGFQSSLAMAQREDAETVASGLSPKEIAPFSVPRRLFFFALGLSAALTLATFMPNPMYKVLEDRAATAKTIEAERVKIEQVKKELLETPLTDPTTKQEELQRALDRLIDDLSSPSLSKEEALANISAAEEKLSQLIDQSLPSERLGLEQLARGLQSLSKIDPSLQAGTSSNPEQLGEDVSKVAEKLSDMSQSERDSAADTLSFVAGSMSGSNPTLATQLGKAADSLKADDSAGAEEALDQAAKELSEMDRRLADQRAAERALAQLQASRGAVAGSGSTQEGTFVRSTDGGNTVSPGGAGQGGQQGSSNQGSSGGQNGQSGNSQGSGNSSSPGSGTGAPSGSGPVAGTNATTSPGATSSSTGQPATGRPGTTGTGDFEPVYTPGGVDSEGKPLFLPSGPDQGESESRWASTQPGTGNSVVPYSQIFDSYSAAAARSLESSYIPTNLKDYVRGYFTSLEPAPKE